MITYSETNFVYFSDLIRTKYKSFWEGLEPILIENKILYGFIDNTKDVWCRDYMPVQINENAFTQFRYLPDYLMEDPKYKFLVTLPHEYKISHKLDPKYCDLIIDGGNIVKSKNAIILTKKIFDENPNFSQDEIISLLKETLLVEKVFIIPGISGDYTGHADGMVRFYNEDTLFVSDCSSYLKNKLKSDLDKTGLKIKYFPSVACNERNADGDLTAKGVYINFAQIGNIILFPQFGFPEDEDVLEKSRALCPDCTFIPVDSKDIAMDGGVLNCITWNIKQS